MVIVVIRLSPSFLERLIAGAGKNLALAVWRIVWTQRGAGLPCKRL
jgi:hypothetical protein